MRSIFWLLRCCGIESRCIVMILAGVRSIDILRVIRSIALVRNITSSELGVATAWRGSHFNIFTSSLNPHLLVAGLIVLSLNSLIRLLSRLVGLLVHHDIIWITCLHDRMSSVMLYLSRIGYTLANGCLGVGGMCVCMPSRCVLSSHAVDRIHIATLSEEALWEDFVLTHNIVHWGLILPGHTQIWIGPISLRFRLSIVKVGSSWY